MVSRVIPVDTFDLVIFGGTGDLARRKILPGLYRRYLAGQMPEGSRVVGASRSDLDDAGYRDEVRAALEEFVEPARSKPEAVEGFLASLHFVSIDATGEKGWPELRELMRDDCVQAFYFSVAPSLFGALAERLHAHDIADAQSRIVVEKPFGRDLESARALNSDARGAFRRDPDLPHRPLSRQGDGAEPDGAPLRQRPLRAAVEQPVRGPHPDHRRRDGGRRRPRRLLRQVRRHARHGAEPHDAAAVPHRHGAALAVRARRGARREAEGHPRPRPRPPRRHRARPVRGPERNPLLPSRRREPREPHRELHRHEAPRLQLAMGRHAVLHPHRQAAARQGVGDRGRLQGRAAFDLRRRGRAAPQHPDDPPAAERGDGLSSPRSRNRGRGACA